MLKLLKSLDLIVGKGETGSARSRSSDRLDSHRSSRSHPSQGWRIEVWLQDEARIGRTGRNCLRLRGLLTESLSDIDRQQAIDPTSEGAGGRRRRRRD